jgi:hypothetical protein
MCATHCSSILKRKKTNQQEKRRGGLNVRGGLIALEQSIQRKKKMIEDLGACYLKEW